MWLSPLDVFCHWATYYPARVAVQVSGTNVTYSELASRALAVADRISEQTTSKTNRPRCAVVSNLKLDFLVAAYGAMFARCSLIVVNPKLSEPQLAQLLNENDAKHLVCDSSVLALAQGAAKVVTSLQPPIALSTASTMVLEHDNLLRWKLDSSQGQLNDEWGVVFSSGSTGVPKGIVQSYLGVISESLAWCLELELRRDTRFFVARPLFYTGGLALTLACHTVGATVVIADGDDTDPDATLSGLEAATTIGNLDWVFFVPEQARAILALQRTWKFPGNPASILLMGSKTSGQEKRSLSKLFGAQVVESWGISEGSGTITSPGDLSIRAESIGRPFIGEHVLVVNENCEPVPTRTVGRLAGTESTMFTEYAGAPAETALTKRRGLVLSADMGYRDDDGYLYILGRTDDVMQLKNGHWITVSEIERQVVALTCVEDVAAVFSKDEQIKVGLLVLLKDGFKKGNHVAEIEAPVRRAFLDQTFHLKTLIAEEIPRLATGKTDRVTIRKMLGWSK